MVAGIILITIGSHEVTAKQNDCKKSALNLATSCSNYVLKSGAPKVKPSPACCRVVKTVDLPCVCNFVTKDIEKVIDMEKVVFVASCCGKKLAPGTKCGSYRVPAA
ncbi:hypothetical protein UlMin_028998 [Ulmus minor]